MAKETVKKLEKQVKQVKAKQAAKTLSGKILNLNTGINTMRVVIERKERHPKYERLIKRHKKYLVHVEEAEKANLHVNQIVEIAQTKPMSARKSWLLVK